MLNQRTGSRHSSLLWGSICLLCLCIFSFLFQPGTVLARTRGPQIYTRQATHHQSTSAPGIDRVQVGYDGSYQDGTWVPVQVTLSNGGADFDGKLSITLPSTTYNGSGLATLVNSYQQ